MDFNFDGAHDRQQCYGNGNSEDQYVVGDWDGDGRDNLAVRRGNCFNMDFNFDGVHDRQQCYGNGAPRRLFDAANVGVAACGALLARLPLSSDAGFSSKVNQRPLQIPSPARAQVTNVRRRGFRLARRRTR